MRTHRLLSVTFAVLTLTLLTVSARSQHMVLFESFTNNCAPCPSTMNGVDTRIAFDQSVVDVASSESSKCIHFNEHIINLCDWVKNTDCTLIGGRLAQAGSGGQPLFYGSVDRTEFGGGVPSARGSVTESDWTSEIDAEAGTPEIANLQLSDIKIDTLTLYPSYVLQTDVLVTLNQSISDSIVIRYAILQDNIKDTFCMTNPKTVNDVVRWITRNDTGTYCVFLPGSSAGASQHIICRQEINGPNSASEVPWIFSKLRLIGFLEENPRGDFHVVNAATLKAGLTGIAAPPPSIYLNNKALDGKTVYAPVGLGITYSGTSIPSVDGFYSLDNGATWVQYDTNSPGNAGWPYSYDTWNIPSYLSSTQAKVKLVIHGTNITAVESGTFTIIRGSSVSWVRPVFGEKDTANALSHFTLQWSKFAVDSVSLQYQVQFGGQWGAWHPIPLAKNLTASSFDWILPDTVAYVQVRLLPDTKAESNGATSQLGGMIVIQRSVLPPQGVAPEAPAPLFAIQDVYPNPVTGGDMYVRYTLSKPCDLQFEVMDLLGHLLILDRSSVIEIGQYRLNTSALPNGSYIVRISDGQHTASKRMEIVR